MGFSFVSAEERNPELQGHSGIERPKTAEEWEAEKANDLKAIKEELDMMTNFLQDNGYIMLYDQYKEIIKERERIAELERTSNGFEEVK